MKLLIFSLILVVLAAVSLAEVQNEFKGYKVHRITLETREQLEFLNQLYESLQEKGLIDEVEIWTENGKVDEKKAVSIMVSPGQEKDFLRLLDQEKIQHQVIIPDLAVTLQEESKMSPEDRRVVDNGGMTWTAYHRYATIEAYIHSLARDYPDLVTLTTLGRSYEGRNLYLLKIGKARKDGETKPAIWMDSQIHAREWIAGATLTFMINKMVTEYAADNSTSRRMLDEIDWFVLPIVNVDGYEFTHSEPANRFWRHTRRVNPFSPNMGADPNRNYDYKWMVSGAVQDTNPPRNTIYAGAYPFSEVENVYLSDAVLQHRQEIKAFLTFHSAAQMWLTPWGFDGSEPDDHLELKAMGIKATNALKALYGTRYQVGSSTSLLGASAGASDDWAKAKAMIKYSFTIELRQLRGATGLDVFLLPPNQIIPSGLETFEAINVVAEIIHSEFGPTLKN